MNRTSLPHGIEPTEVEITCVLSAKAQIGEGPWWSTAEQKLYWVDIVGKNIHVFDPATGKVVVASPSQPVAPGSRVS